MSTKAGAKVIAQRKTARTLHKNKLHAKETAHTQSYATIFASAVGGGTIGSALGVPGAIVGAAIGAGVGAYMKYSHA